VVGHTGSSAQGAVGNTDRAVGGERLSGNIDLHAISDSIFVYMCYGICKLEKALLFSKKRSIGLQRAVTGRIVFSQALAELFGRSYKAEQGIPPWRPTELGRVVSAYTVHT
jgi:hypothetical protein